MQERKSKHHRCSARCDVRRAAGVLMLCSLCVVLTTGFLGVRLAVLTPNSLGWALHIASAVVLLLFGLVFTLRSHRDAY